MNHEADYTELMVVSKGKFWAWCSRVFSLHRSLWSKGCFTYWPGVGNHCFGKCGFLSLHKLEEKAYIAPNGKELFYYVKKGDFL